MEKQDLNNDLLNLASGPLNEEHAFGPPYWFGGVTDNGEIIGCGIHVRPDGLVITEVPDLASHYVVKSLGPFSDQLCHLYGPVETAEKFADLWSEKMNISAVIQSRWHVYRADQLNSPRIDAPGNLLLG